MSCLRNPLACRLTAVKGHTDTQAKAAAVSRFKALPRPLHGRLFGAVASSPAMSLAKSLASSRYRAILTAALVLLAAFSPLAQAGRPCTADKPSAQAIIRGLTLAENTLASLNASGHRVVVLARAGQDLSR